ncbi:MAG: ATP-binding cassette domain-containing protein [Pyrobaculum sp.]
MSLLIDLAAGYRGRVVVEVKAEVPAGVTAVVGPNGSGKSTLFRAVAGVIKPSRGGAFLDGRPLLPGEVAYLPHAGGFDPNAVVRDEVEFYWEVLGAVNRETVFEALGLGEVWEKKVGDLSHGQRRRAELATVLALRRRVYLLDEPLKGLDVQYRDAVLRLLKTLGGYVLYTTHEPNAVEGVADWVLALRGGGVAYSGPLSGLGKRAVIKARKGAESLVVETEDAASKMKELEALGYVVEEVSNAGLRSLMA